MTCVASHFQKTISECITGISFDGFIAWMKSVYSSKATFRTQIHSGIIIKSTRPQYHLCFFPLAHKSKEAAVLISDLLTPMTLTRLVVTLCKSILNCGTGKERAERTYPHEDRGDRRAVSFILAHLTVILLLWIVQNCCDNGTARQQENIF